MRDYSFDVLELVSELKFNSANAKPLKLLARDMDMPRRKVVALIKKARAELAPDVLIINNGRNSYYMKGSLYYEDRGVL